MLEVNFQLQWNYKGQKGKETLFHTAIGNFITAMSDWSPAFEAIAQGVLEPAVDEQFLTAGHGEWTALALSTIKRKGHDTILFFTGKMYRSFQKGGTDHVEEITRESLRWGSSNLISLFQHTGTGSGFQMQVKGPGPGIPMRKIIDLGEDKKRLMRSIFVRQLAAISRRAGFRILGSQTDVDPMTARMAGMKMLGFD